MEQKKMNNKGFSLVELIIVIAIMAILVGVLAPQFMKYVESSRQSTDIQNASSIRSAIEAGVADGTVVGTVKVEVASNKIKVSVSGTGATLGDALTSVGLAAETDCKSQGWPAAEVASYASYTWTPNSSYGVNSVRDLGKSITDAFK